QTIKADAPLDIIPLYVKAGSILLFGPEIQYSTQPTNGTLKVRVYTGADAQFMYYEDEATNYNYEKGDFSFIPFTYNEADGTLTIGSRDGGFEQMAEERTLEILFIDEASKAPFSYDTKPDVLVKYKGEALTVKKK
ncbi:MAG: DUF5110 domain-containing protein, partial [Prolixibacteraceae bacterium]|nr:DUF5110 domain-containing protein [Prolixibacteraceae bacterium]